MAVDEDDRWTCTLCGKHWPVPSLARDCEVAHLEAEAVSEQSGTAQSR